MKFKIAIFFTTILLAACQNSYKADLSLKQAWSEELENTQPSKIPYALIYKTGNKKLIYVAFTANSGKRPQSNAIIESLIERDRPEVVLVQGHEKGKVVSASEVKFHLGNHKPILKGISASRQDVLDHLSSYGITERDYAIVQTILIANQIWQYEVNKHQDLKEKIDNYLLTDFYTKKYHLSYNDVKNWFLQKMGYPLTDNLLISGQLLAPMDPNLKSTTLLQKISTYTDEVDDNTAMDTLAKELGENNTVMIIRASSKYVTERKVLHNMLGIDRPSEIIN